MNAPLPKGRKQLDSPLRVTIITTEQYKRPLQEQLIYFLTIELGTLILTN